MELERTIEVGGQKVRMRASGATVRIYRNMFNRDMLLDMQYLTEAVEKVSGGTVLDNASLEVFENAAYTMAYHAAKVAGEDGTFPETPDEWLEEFSIFSIYDTLPQIVELWNINNKTLVAGKKK